MQSNAARIGVLAALAAAAVVLFIVLSGDDSGDSGDEVTSAATTTETVAGASAETIRVRNGEPVGGVREIEVTRGDRVRFTVESDVAEEVHVHGYDLSKDVAAGGSVTFDFPADLDGVFEVELEGTATQIIELTVQPG
jgi:FtsP/CotA-like multicopper oxidase with cupredoxin domain